MRRIWENHDALIVLLGIAALALVGVGAALVWGSLQEKPVNCTTDIVFLSDPTNPLRMFEALIILEEEGVISTVEEARESLESAHYVFDPDKDYEIEYWLFFEGDQIVQFNIGCPNDEETNLEYEGVR